MLLGSKGSYPFAAGAKRWRKATVAAMLYALADIRAVLQAWPDHPNSGWYADEAHTVNAELKRRRG